MLLSEAHEIMNDQGAVVKQAHNLVITHTTVLAATLIINTRIKDLTTAANTFKDAGEQDNYFAFQERADKLQYAISIINAEPF